MPLGRAPGVHGQQRPARDSGICPDRAKPLARTAGVRAQRTASRLQFSSDPPSLQPCGLDFGAELDRAAGVSSVPPNSRPLSDGIQSACAMVVGQLKYTASFDTMTLTKRWSEKPECTNKT